MNNYTVIDSIMFIIVTVLCLYSLDAVNFKKLLKASNPRKAFMFYMLFSLALSALVFTFYVYLKEVMIGL